MVVRAVGTSSFTFTTFSGMTISYTVVTDYWSRNIRLNFAFVEVQVQVLW